MPVMVVGAGHAGRVLEGWRGRVKGEGKRQEARGKREKPRVMRSVGSEPAPGPSLWEGEEEASGKREEACEVWGLGLTFGEAVA